MSERIEGVSDPVEFRSGIVAGLLIAAAMSWVVMVGLVIHAAMNH